MAKSRGQKLADSVTGWSGGDVGEVVCQLREVRENSAERDKEKFKEGDI